MSLYPADICRTCGRYELTSCNCKPEVIEEPRVPFADLVLGQEYHIDSVKYPNPFNGIVLQKTEFEVEVLVVTSPDAEKRWVYDEDFFYNVMQMGVAA